MKVLISIITIAAIATACSPNSMDASVETHQAPTQIEKAPSDLLPGGTAMFDSPWSNPETSLVIDAYEGNSINWNQLQTDARVAGVIHRSSMGLQTDQLYLSRKKTAQQLGYLWGAFHLGTSDDPIAQAKLFIELVGDDPNTLIALDLEDTDSPQMMNISNAVLFMNYFFSQTQRLPIVYANNSVTESLNEALAKNALFSKTRLWYARFVSNVDAFPKGIWSTYFLWQFSSEINCSTNGSCPYRVPGTAHDIDVNVFYGSKAELQQQWN